MEDDLISGLIVHAQSSFFDVEISDQVVVCQLRGRLKQESRVTDLAAAGDRVRIRRLDDGTGVIEEVLPRQRVLSRRDPGRDAEQVLIANPDQAIFVFACADPEPNFRMLDRFLVVAERESIPAIICVNKLDLVERRSVRQAFAEYPTLGYPVLFTSALCGSGIKDLRRTLKGRISVLAGPSGAGKTSLLNAVQPGLNLATGAISNARKEGRHTTVAPRLIRLQGGGHVADTPGLKALALWDIEPEELDAYFPEMRSKVSQCGFSDCSHTHEPGCAVIAAVEGGEISLERYDSYLRMRAGDPD
jgi:ribosome biogenesis GTPase